MKPAQSGGPDYVARIRRAQYLAGAYPFAAEVLTFYKEIAEFQKHLYGQMLQAADSPRPLQGKNRSAPNFTRLLPNFSDLLALLQGAGPAPVRDTARRLSAHGQAAWTMKLTEFWKSGLEAHVDSDNRPEPLREPLTEFILRAFVQPVAEFAEAGSADPPLTANNRSCPRCGAAPLVGVLRPEGDGGKRRLQCSFCLREWDSRRIFCVACGEYDEKKLPVYVAEQFPHIRVEACETCKFYVRTIDLTKDGNAVPLVDDLSAMPLSLWAQEHGYQRVHENLLGT